MTTQRNAREALESAYPDQLADEEVFERRYKAQKRLIRILTGALLRAVRDDDFGVAEFMADRIRHHTYNLGSV